MEKRIKREEIFKGRILDVCVDDVELDDGKKAIREVIVHNGGVCIAVKDLSDNKFFLVKQYRYVQEKEMLEFCAGKIEKGEDKDLAIIREANEELGYEVKNVRRLGQIIPTCAYCGEIDYLYYGEIAGYIGQHLDEDESLNVYKFTFKEIKEMIKNGTIDDAKTIALMYQIELAGLDE